MPGLLRCVLLLATSTIALAQSDLDQKISDAVAHFDQGQFDKAISLLEEVLDEDPDNGLAAYELAYSHKAKGDTRTCIKVARQALRRVKGDGEQTYLVPQLSMMLATCYSDSGKARKALRAFRDGLALAPDDYLLNFNIAITLAREGKLDEALGHLQNASVADPMHPSPFYYLASVHRERGETAQAMLATLSFLQRESNTERSAAAAGAVIDLLYSRTFKDEASGAINLYWTPGDNEEPSDTELLTLTLSLVAITSLGEDGQSASVDAIAESLQSFLSFVAEHEFTSPEDSFLVSYLVSDVRRMEQEGVTEAFIHFVLSQVGIEDAIEWLEENPEETDALVQFLQLLRRDGGRGQAPVREDQSTG